MFERLRNSFLNSNYRLLAVEFVVVILSILIAFQIERWGEERRDREQELEYLQRLKVDLQIEMQSMEEALQFAQSRIDNVLLLEKVVADLSVVQARPGDVAEAVEKATWRSFPQINALQGC